MAAAGTDHKKLPDSSQAAETAAGNAGAESWSGSYSNCSLVAGLECSCLGKTMSLVEVVVKLAGSVVDSFLYLYF